MHPTLFVYPAALARYRAAPLLAERERWLRRQAMQIVVQLPEEDADAMQVLDYARKLVRPA